jgi:hypothetical protein
MRHHPRRQPFAQEKYCCWSGMLAYLLAGQHAGLSEILLAMWSDARIWLAA